jgi:hypothetical protein
MANTEPDLRFESVLSNRSSEKRTALFVFPAVLVFALIVGLAVISISRMSGLSTQVAIAQKQVEEANKVVEERDKQLRDAHAETAVLASAGQGASVLAPIDGGSTASGVALDHPAQHALGVYAFNLTPAPEGQDYRLIATDGAGQESLLGALVPDDRGAAFLLARDVPEGIAKLEVALVPKSASPAPNAAAVKTDKEGGASVAQQVKPPAERKPVLTGTLPRPGEAGVVAAAAPGAAAAEKRVQGRGGSGGRRR